MIHRVLASVFALLLAVGVAWAVEPDEMLADPYLEKRARVLSKQLRCVVCLNQDIDSSNAGVARTMRLLLRERLVDGDSDAEVLDFFVDRYGDFVLFRPPLKGSTYVLWLAPFAIFGAGATAVTMTLRRRRPRAEWGETTALSPEEEHELMQIANNGETERT
ncbi:cytochrome c-type biogenesis protein [Jannaschia sp. M317]|uniref:cytochrome c-type biogenesis protein n=1 Tax=Jannaschia sp. M317 TaxID=2867011 RepID=UPI0021A3FCC1|nr:cytochrome c-type biogenesis protein [Jannaschia sp. M317]UWQ19760.1 cytochrome c-type biogenesis protein CcmH [Jannaschia sp. M317]